MGAKSAAFSISLALFLLPQRTVAAPGCSVNVGGDILFGTYDVFAPTPLDTSVRLRLVCPKGQAPMVMISKGNSATYAPRTLVSGPLALPYNLFLDVARQVVWGDGTEGTSYWTAPGGTAQAQIYARIPAGQDAVAGDYSDSVVLTIFL